ncbi:hypothetical protein M8C21_011338 [Ambrosia artemisiifolia]|uniref:DUF676 domain-containing protein n=1 Tax=Ambrosia artemisiifolia TaxID=4212 RepID=A0AAD5G7D6_AMBAR|nr:hypothetical protein M8C21_011338 [Ambrosia artemisiifolia]
MESENKVEEMIEAKRSDANKMNNNNNNNNMEKKKNIKRVRSSVIVKRLGCFRSSDLGHPTIDEFDGDGNVDMTSASNGSKQSPTHLVVMVNGLIGSIILYTRESTDDHCLECGSSARIAGLVPINFITIATPHLGTGGHKQVPMFGGSNTVEKVANQISWVLGRTGRHLFLTDKAHAQPPLLLQMVKDGEDLNSALQSFRRHVVYANAHFDHIVGWSTSSIRRRNELPQRKHLVRSDKYPHILKGEQHTTNTIKQEPSIKSPVNNFKAARASMEEAMIRGLTKISWERIDVSFKGSKQRYFAHNTIQVNTPWMNSDGADVIQHLVDNFHLHL